MVTLGIETSCDETAVCLLETKTGEGDRNGNGKNENGTDSIEYRIIENLIHSQADLHAKYGGVFPMMAKREHEKNLPILIEKILGREKIDLIAVTKGPGLEPALRVGVDYAKKLGEKLNVPVIGVNHMEGHVLGSLLTSSEPASPFTKLIVPSLPALALLISGGHTELVLVKENRDKKDKNHAYEYEVIGRTKDDAVGEAFDKVARLLGLSYPGGPHVSALAKQARNDRNDAVKQNELHLPRPMLHSADLNFSFSGLKTAVLYEIRKTDKNVSMKPQKNTDTGEMPDHGLDEAKKKEIAREFEDAVTEVLMKKTGAAIEKYAVQSLIAGGGVTANGHIREALQKLADENSIPLYLPPAGVSGDNALMIALAGALSAEKKPNPPEPIEAAGNLAF